MVTGQILQPVVNRGCTIIKDFSESVRSVVVSVIHVCLIYMFVVTISSQSMNLEKKQSSFLYFVKLTDVGKIEQCLNSEGELAAHTNPLPTHPTPPPPHTRTHKLTHTHTQTLRLKPHTHTHTHTHRL